ncbi:MAG TPA: glycine cleavage system protein GcvH [Candidatus Dormibacteraeota bacterium]|nr:glycine cleavage system protein GcvH [Candidatus Dormibacteraeota bacterium]
MPDLSAYRFTDSHEWVRPEAAGEVVVGITDFAQSQLGDVIFLELPTVGTVLRAGERLGTVESVKAASDLYSPVAGTVAAVNERVAEQPELVNQDPYDAGWLVRVALEGAIPAELLDAAAYDSLVADQAG